MCTLWRSANFKQFTVGFYNDTTFSQTRFLFTYSNSRMAPDSPTTRCPDSFPALNAMFERSLLLLLLFLASRASHDSGKFPNQVQSAKKEDLWRPNGIVFWEKAPGHLENELFMKKKKLQYAIPMSIVHQKSNG